MENIIIGLVFLMIANILLGVTLSTFRKEFSFKKLIFGIFKALCVVIACILMYISGNLNPDLLIANIGGVNLNLVGAMKALFIAGIIMYGYNDLVHLKELLGISIDIVEPDNKDVVCIPKENNIRGDTDV